MYFNLFSMLKIHHKSQNSGIVTIERTMCCWASYCILVWVPELFKNTVLLETVNIEPQELFESKKKNAFQNNKHRVSILVYA